jgi:hypothetical protein
MDNTEKCNFEYITSLQYKKEEQLLQEQFNKAHTVIGTQWLHVFVPVSSNRLKTKIY